MTQSLKSIKVKVCGITDPINLMEIAAMYPDYLGFIFYPPSPRDVTHNIKYLPLDGLPISIQKVAVLLDQPLEDVLSIIKKYGFDLVQLHGKETPDYCKALRSHLPVIKSFAIKDRLPANLSDYESCCDYFLFDTKGPQPGGTGISFDHHVLEAYEGKTPFFLSGGIGPEFPDQAQPFQHSMLAGIDVNSRFETSPGVKDVSSLANFIKRIKNK